MGNTPLDLICGCKTTCERENGSYEVLRVSRGCHRHLLGDVISRAEANRIRYVNDEWDRAEAEYLEQS